MRNEKLCEAIVSRLEGDWLEKDQVSEVLDALREEVIERTAKGETVHLFKLGTFKREHRQVTVRKLRGVLHVIPAHETLDFNVDDDAIADMSELIQLELDKLAENPSE